MKSVGTASDDLERMAEEAIAAIDDWSGREVLYEPAAVAVVSPIHRAVESACFNLEVDGEALFMKVRHADMRPFFDDAAVAEACRVAQRAGVAPALRHSLPERGVLVLDRLGEDWRWAKVSDFAEADVLSAAVEAKRALHEGEALPRTRSVFQVIERYWSMIEEEGATLPGDARAVLSKVRAFAEAIAAAGMDARPCHGDGVASNHMIGPGSALRLVDFDMAANCDPYFDLGSLMVEAFQFAQDMRLVLEIYDGRVIEAHYNRCRLYGIADDFMWALWGFLCFKLSPRREVEFTKYAEWRLLRCRWQLADPDVERWTRRL